MMKFFLPMIPPRTTAQQAKIAVQDGKPRRYMPEKLKDVKALYLAYLSKFAPAEPMKGPLYLRVDWFFNTKTKEQDNTWKVTAPDTDNLNKLFKDCMTECGFWKDDAQVAYEIITKQWSYDKPGIMVTVMGINNQVKSSVEYRR